MQCSFEKFWDESPEFRSLFVGSGRVFPDMDIFDKGLAQTLWANRKPCFMWDMCGVDGCRTMIKRGDRCSKHLEYKGKMPTWRWVRGRLYKFVSIYPVHEDVKRIQEYVNYERYVAEQRYGVVPRGWDVGRLNGNPFDMGRDNVIIMTKISMAALALGYIAPKQTSELDRIVSGFVAKNMGPGVKPFIGIYGYSDIARVARCKVSSVRREAREGTLDPDDLVSVVDFVRRRRYCEDKVKLVAHGQG